MLYSNKVPKEIVSDAFTQKGEDVTDQLDCIEDSIITLREDMRDLRFNLVLLENLRSGTTGITI